jgi:hypothetical protein
MGIYEQIIAIYPELEGSNAFTDLTIILQDDCDGQGVFIAKWDYSKPLPEGLKIGK